MHDSVIAILLVVGAIASGALVVWAFTADDRQAMKEQVQELENANREREAVSQQRVPANSQNPS